MKKILSILLVALLAVGACGAALVTGGNIGQTAKQETNTTVTVLLALFVTGTLWTTKWTTKRTRSVVDFYMVGGGITGFQDGPAISGDYMSATSFLGISTAMMASGYDGLIYSTSFLVGWPIITFLMVEWLCNLGKFTFADVVGYQFG